MARKKKTAETASALIDVVETPAPVEEVIETSVETTAETPVEVIETAAEQEVVIETAPEAVVEEVKETPKPKAEKKEKAPKADKKSKLSVGTKELFAARIYASSVAKKPIALAKGTIYIVDTEEHDGRIRVALNELLEKIGWADISEIER
jgi:hypothetical protein